MSVLITFIHIEASERNNKSLTDLFVIHATRRLTSMGVLRTRLLRLSADCRPSLRCAERGQSH